MRTTHPNRERARSGNEIGMHTMIQSRSQSMPVRGLGTGMTREQAYSGNEIGMHINLADTT